MLVSIIYVLNNNTTHTHTHTQRERGYVIFQCKQQDLVQCVYRYPGPDPRLSLWTGLSESLQSVYSYMISAHHCTVFLQFVYMLIKVYNKNGI